MPRITKSGPARFMATKLYLITSTVATGVGGGFLFPVVPPWLDTPHRGFAVLKNGKVVPTASLRRGCHPVTITSALAVVPWLPRPRHHNASPPERLQAFPGEFFISGHSSRCQASRSPSSPSFRFLTTYQVAPMPAMTTSTVPITTYASVPAPPVLGNSPPPRELTTATPPLSGLSTVPFVQ